MFGVVNSAPGCRTLSIAVGVGQFATAVRKSEFGRPLSRRVWSGPPALVVAVIHPEDEEAFSLMRRANFRRSDEDALNRKAHTLKVSVNPLGAAAREHAANVLDEDEPGA